MKKGYPRFHGVTKCLAIEVCEGEGTKESPCATVYYIIDEQGKMLGKVDKFNTVEGMEEEDETK